MRRLSLMAALLAIVAAPACTQDDRIGEGPITLSAEVEYYYEEFKKLHAGVPIYQSYYFIVSKDGRSSAWTYCPVPAECANRPITTQAIHHCEKLSGGVPCYIYADDKGVLWRGEVKKEPGRECSTPGIPCEILQCDLGQRGVVHMPRTTCKSEGGWPAAQSKCRLPDGVVLDVPAKRCKELGGLPYDSFGAQPPTRASGRLQAGYEAQDRGDYAEARREFEPLAQRGIAEAQYEIGQMYAKGQGVPQDFVTAHMWFNLAAANGDADAGEERDALASRMTPAQIAEAQKMAREWMERHQKAD